MSLAAAWVMRRTAARSRVVGLMPNLDSSAPVAAQRLEGSFSVQWGIWFPFWGSFLCDVPPST